MDYFRGLYAPVELQSPLEHEMYLKDVLKATGIIIHGEGDIPHVEMELHRKWREERESGAKNEVGFN